MKLHDRSRLPEQHKSLLTDRALIVVGCVAVTVLYAAIAITAVRHVSLADVAEDPSATTGANPLTGALSNLGVGAWTVGAAVAVFAAYVVRRTGGDRTIARFLLTGGVLTGYLAVDDLFLIHDEAIATTPLPQPAFLGLLVLAFAAYLYVFRPTVATTEWHLLVLAATLFGCSLAIDFGSDLGKYLHSWTTPAGVTFIEDGLKWLGIVTWTTYIVRVSAAAVVGTSTEPGRPSGPPSAPSN